MYLNFALSCEGMTIHARPTQCNIASNTDNIAKIHICIDASTVYVRLVIVTSEKHSFCTPYTSFSVNLAPNPTFYGPPAPKKQNLRLGEKDIPPVSKKKTRFFRAPKLTGDFMRNKK